MDLAKEMMYSQRLPEAIIILKDLEKKYPDEENIKFLYSQALYWNKDFSNTISYIRSSAHPSDGLKLHYGKILFELNRLSEAGALLSSYLITHPDDTEALLIMAKINYWSQGSARGALRYVNQILQKDPLHPEALQLRDAIYVDTAPNLRFNAGYYHDSQPLQAMNYMTRFSFYHSAWLQPAVQVNHNQYSGGEQVLLTDISNRVALPNTNTEIVLAAGVFSNSWSNELRPTWSLAFKQKTFKNIFLTAEAARRPYLFTLTSIGQNVVPVSLAGGLNKESDTGWTGNLTLHQWQFIDENRIKTLSSWFLIPIAKAPVFRIDVGYAFMMADADYNRFSLEEPHTAPMGFGEVIPGVFNPYFTPQNQMVHAALAKIDINITRKFKATINSNIGIYATIDNPNYVYYGAPTVPVTGKGPSQMAQKPNPEPEAIHLVLIPTRYLPIDIKGRLSMELNRSVTLHTEWSYLSTIYFNSQTANVGFNWNFARR